MSNDFNVAEYGPLNIGPDGYSMTIRLEGTAAHQLDAADKARAKGYYRGAPLKIYGRTPNRYVVCDSMSINERSPAGSGTGLYDVICNYTSLSIDMRPDKNKPPEYYYNPGIEQVPVDFDVNGKPIANTVGEPYNDVTRDRGTFDMAIVWYVETFKFSEITSYYNTVNLKDWTLRNRHKLVIEAERARILHITPEDINDKLTKLTAQVTVGEIETTAKGIKLYPHLDNRLNAGFLKLVNGEAKPIRLPNGDIPSEPQLISKAGALLTPAQVEKGNVHINQFEHYRKKDFAELGI